MDHTRQTNLLAQRARQLQIAGDKAYSAASAFLITLTEDMSALYEDKRVESPVPDSEDLMSPVADSVVTPGERLPLFHEEGAADWSGTAVVDLVPTSFEIIINGVRVANIVRSKISSLGYWECPSTSVVRTASEGWGNLSNVLQAIIGKVCNMADPEMCVQLVVPDHWHDEGEAKGE